jgi:site-specific DNA-methyltransferase (adenine-specific)
MTVHVEHLAEGVTLYLGDCREIAHALARPAALVSDPPYGQELQTNVFEAGQRRHYRESLPRQGESAIRARRKVGTYTGSQAVTIWPDGIVGDDAPFDPLPWLNAAPRVLLWGAHRFADRLPAGTWLVWDKVPTGKVRDQGDGEAAWLNDDPPRPMRLFRLLWDGVCVGSAARSEVTAGQQRVHPTQKPVVLMEWCIQQARVPPGGANPRPLHGRRLHRRRRRQARPSVRRHRDRTALLRHGVPADRRCAEAARHVRRPAAAHTGGR